MLAAPWSQLIKNNPRFSETTLVSDEPDTEKKKISVKFFLRIIGSQAPTKVNVYHLRNPHGEEARRFDISHMIAYYMPVLSIRIRHHQENACLTRGLTWQDQGRFDHMSCFNLINH
jgi:hypothetical protein